MTKTCTHCSAQFEVIDEDLQFYDTISPIFGGKKYGIPPPSKCPDCRAQRRLTHRNERTLYQRTCDASGENMISIYAPDSEYPVFCQEEWWSDSWDPLSYGREFDFSKTFFEQFDALWRKTPQMGLCNFNCENSVYNNFCSGLKDCYLCIASDNGQNNLYSYVCENCNDCVDCSFIHKSELCYECFDCYSCYTCTFSENLENCTECSFSSDLVGCTQCFACHGLRKKNYCIFNEQVTVEEYATKVKHLAITEHVIKQMKERSKKIHLSVPQLFAKIVHSEGANGDHIYHCNNAVCCFDVNEGESLRNVIYAPWGVHHAHDLYAGGECEWVYEYIGGGVNISHSAFHIVNANGLNDAYYCVQCFNGCRFLFGCIGLKKKEYCILNTQYTKSQYEDLVPKIIDSMRKTGEWGEFFPASLSPFAYNETVAAEMFPLTKQEAARQGMRWRESDQKEQVQQTYSVPEKIIDVGDTITKESLACSSCKKNFRIIPQELSFYRRMNLSVPKLCPGCRHDERMQKRNPRKLWDRNCSKCQKPIQTTYAPNRPEKVYCEECYLKEVY